MTGISVYIYIARLKSDHQTGKTSARTRGCNDVCMWVMNPGRRDRSILLSLILDQFKDDLTPMKLGMLHADLDRAAGLRDRHAIRGSRQPAAEIDGAAGICIRRGAVARARSGQTAAVVEADDAVAGDDLAETAVHRVADFDEVVVEEDQEAAVQTG